jgi:hypothetical protein
MHKTYTTRNTFRPQAEGKAMRTNRLRESREASPGARDRLGSAIRER